MDSNRLQKGAAMSGSDLPADRVGWIGTGRMGAAMAARLATAGVELAAWNRTRAKAEPLAEHGATVVDTIAELADRDVVFTMVAASADLEQVLTGDGGLLRQAAVPALVIDCSTVSNESSAAMRAACAERGAEFLAAPVSGNGKVVAAGKLSLVVSGDRAAYDRAAPLLAIVGRASTYVGEGETARLVKICHNLLLGVMAQSLAEITVLAEKGGVPRAALLSFINDSVVGSMFTRYKSPAYVRLDYTPTFTPVLLRKDFDLGLAAARAMDVPMPIAAATAQLIQAAIGAGHSSEDFAVLLAEQARAAGLDLKPEDTPVDDGLGS
ncbi:MAG TPA: NAD(P)-dependent oxidoreductase [Mycobacteriales bacterium]|nr:NAD(P)-dependent oxidoreductase [Mycobacteriales bacterium]